ncbi:flavocytochrome c [Shewanella halifaxensis]|uniref:flavocytochrome c n=1 Tax=Shewanella halifaxensis TaxID=271098 RepID=UPI000D590694|nr:flavocytochrome c [Shewanella halifaxensis]
MKKLTLLSMVICASFSVNAADNLAEFHKESGIECKDCHATGVKNIQDSQLEQDKACISCHGDLNAIATEELKEKELSVHHNHLVDIGCTSCHSGHVEPVMNCITCHQSFTEKFAMPFLNGKLKASIKFDDVSEKELTDAIKAGPVETHQMIIIGAGSAGYSAAVQAKMSGLDDIIIFEKQPYIGGNSQLSAGGYSAAETIAQARLGYKDGVEQFYNDTMKGGHNINDPKLVKKLTEDSADGLSWLTALGGDFSAARRGGGHTADRLHRPAGGKKNGPELISVLQRNSDALGVKVETNNKVLKIVRAKSGEIAGVVVQGKHSGLRFIAAQTVVLATGGFGWDNKLVAQYRPDLLGTPSTNAPGNTGDGIGLAKGIGAKMVDLKEIQTFPTAGNGVLVITGTIRGAGAILLNHQGKRFCDEMGPRDKVSECIWKLKERSAWLVWDEEIMNEVSQVKGLEPLGMLTKIESYNDFKKVNIDPAVAKVSIEQYNKYQKDGNDPDFGRKFMARSLMFPLYLVDTSPAIHHTMGGVGITPEAQVRDENDNIIPGMFAAGEVTGGVHGANRLGGNAIADTVVFGRQAGKSAAHYIINKGN